MRAVLYGPPNWLVEKFSSEDRRMFGFWTIVLATVGAMFFEGDTPEYTLPYPAMTLDWMTASEINQAIPPSYTEYIGARLLEHVRARAVA